MLAMLAPAVPASADLTAFVGASPTPSNRAVRGFAVGFSLLVVGFEFELSDTAADTAAGAPAVRTGMFNMHVQTPFGISGLQIGKNAKAEFPQIGLGSGSPEQTGLAGSKDIWGEDRNNNIWLITKVAHHVICSGDDPNYTVTVELANTMRNTKKKLPVYGSLSGYGGAPGR